MTITISHCTITYEQDTSGVVIKRIHTPKEHRRKGYAGKALSKFAGQVKEPILLFVFPYDRTITVDSLMRFYRKFGFRRIGKGLLMQRGKR